MTIEYRLSTAPAPTVTMKRTTTGSATLTTVSGYAAVFNTETVIAGYFLERLASGAFRDALRRDDVRALFNHDANRVLGRTASGTLHLTEDARGLKYTIELNAGDPLALSVAAMIERRDVNGSSFAFTVQPSDELWTYSKGASMPLRTILRAALIDISPVTFPAYPGTSVTARAALR